MKTLKVLGGALLVVLMSAGLAACGGDSDNDDGGGAPGNIEGTWYLKAVTWYGWKNNKPDMSTIYSQKTFDDYSDTETWTLKKSGENLILTKKESGDEPSTYTLEKVGENEYRRTGGSSNGNDKIVFKSVTAKRMEVEYYDNFYRQTQNKEYAYLIYMR